MPPTVIDLHATTKILDCPRVVASPSMSLRIIIILFSSVRRSTFQKLRKSSNRGPVFAPRLRRDATGNTDDRENADHSQFWCLLTGPAESNPNSRMIRAKTIGVMLMASSIIEKKSQGRENRAELRATDSKRRTKRKYSSRGL